MDYQLAMLSHEFGIFLMHDSIDPIVEEMKEYICTLKSTKDFTYMPWSAFGVSSAVSNLEERIRDYRPDSLMKTALDL